MSRMMLRSNGKPPLARSPVRPKPHRKALQPTNPNTIQTPPGSVVKPQLPKSVWAGEDPDLRPEYGTISRELQALAKMVHRELGDNDDTSMADCGVEPVCPPVFERGRFYDEYSARRNERLKRKKGEMEKKPSYDLGVRRFDSAKKRDSSVKLDGRRMSMVGAAATPVVERRQTQTGRYSLRSSVAVKENRKPPLPVPMPSMSVGVTAKKVGVRRKPSY